MRKRNIRISIRLTEQEHQYLKRQTEASGLKIEPLIRSLIMGLDIRPRPPDEYAGILRELSAIGNNLNQIARNVNASRSATPTELSRALELFGEAWRLIKEYF